MDRVKKHCKIHSGSQELAMKKMNSVPIPSKAGTRQHNLSELSFIKLSQANLGKHVRFHTPCPVSTLHKAIFFSTARLFYFESIVYTVTVCKHPIIMKITSILSLHTVQDITYDNSKK